MEDGHGRVSLDSAEAADTAVASSSSALHAYAGTRMAVESEGSASDDNSRRSEISDASDSGEEEEEVTTRSRRVVKTPANFAAEMAAT
jgi:hypothetical protein